MRLSQFLIDVNRQWCRQSGDIKRHDTTDNEDRRPSEGVAR
jgi:hypothetical protein